MMHVFVILNKDYMHFEECILTKFTSYRSHSNQIGKLVTPNSWKEYPDKI